MKFVPKKISKVFLLTDLEGVAGVEKFSQTREDGPEKDRAMQLLTKEINAVIKGIRAYNSEMIIHCWDGHGSGGIDLDLLKGVDFYLKSGWIHLHDYLKGHSVDALIFVGQHPKAMTFHGNQAHTMSSKNTNYYSINGKTIGEFGLRAAIAGELNIPTIYISGDDKACLEAKCLIPDICCTTVMHGTGWESALSLPAEIVHERQFLDVQIALELAEMGIVEPYTIKPPIELEISRKSFRLILGLLKKGGKARGLKTVLFNVHSFKELQDMNVI